MKKETSWDGVAKWYSDMLEGGDDTYQKKVILPNILRIVGPKNGMNIVDIACGPGYFSRWFAKEGANVVGLDVSRELINRANELIAKDEKMNLRYLVGLAHRTTLEAESQDVAVVILALQNIKNLSEVVAEVSRVVKKGGRFVVVINHPAFRIPKQSSWGYDEVQDSQYRRIDKYMTESEIEIDMNPSKPGSKKTLSFHRSLQVYSKVFANKGFAIQKIEEWISHKKSEKGVRQKAEDEARKEIPLFMMIEAFKI